MIKVIRQASTTAASLALVGSLSFSAFSGIASAQSSRNNVSGNQYHSTQSALNNSNVHGHARLSFVGNQLHISLRASGLIPGMPHPAHIHGQLNGTNATCPTFADDTNHDGYVSVFEGAPKYGPIKLNLTSPQTPFGAPANTVLFAPFAGIPNPANFPTVSKNKQFTLNQTYTFNASNSYDQQAYTSLRALDKQHIVIHGAYAPQNVDTPGGSSQVVYDPLLPVACGEINVIGASANKPERVELKMHSVNPSAQSSHTTSASEDGQATVSIDDSSSTSADMTSGSMDMTTMPMTHSASKNR